MGGTCFSQIDASFNDELLNVESTRSGKPHLELELQIYFRFETTLIFCTVWISVAIDLNVEK